MKFLALASTWALAGAVPSWLPSMGDGKNSACFNQYQGGGTVLAQCGGPTTTQIANNPSEDGSGEVIEWIAITDHSVKLITHSGTEEDWTSNFSGFGTTNWGSRDKSSGSVENFLPKEGGVEHDDTKVFSAQAYNSYIGNSVSMLWEGDTCDDPNGFCGRKSGLDLGYTSYFVHKDVELGDNQFFIGSPQSVNYYLPGCPNYEPGETSASKDFECPRIPVKAGTFKFTILGLLSGGMINSLNVDDPPLDSSVHGALDTSGSVEKDIALYQTMLYRTTLDLGSMGEGYTTKVVGGTHDGKSFDELTTTDDISGSVLEIVGTSSPDPIKISFSDRYSTGSYIRSKADVLDTFGGCSGEDGNTMDLCTRDLTGFKTCADGYCTDSLPGDANEAVRKAGDASMTREALGKLAGAPELKVSEVKQMKITMRPSLGCTDRPGSPAGEDNTGTAGTSWPSASADCPWWMKATRHGGVWAVEGGDHLGQIGVFDMTDCKSGNCWVVDFHIELGGTDLASRTVFGNPANAVGEGWEKGTFFLYDPEAEGNGPLFNAKIAWPIVAGVGAGLLLILTLIVCCCVRCCRKKSDLKNIENQIQGIQMQNP